MERKTGLELVVTLIERQKGFIMDLVDPVEIKCGKAFVAGLECAMECFMDEANEDEGC